MQQVRHAATRTHTQTRSLMYAYMLASYSTVNLLHTEGIKSEVIGTVKNEALGSRLVVLLNRHGLEDCDTSDLADAILDLEARGTE